MDLCIYSGNFEKIGEYAFEFFIPVSKISAIRINPGASKERINQMILEEPEEAEFIKDIYRGQLNIEIKYEK